MMPLSSAPSSVICFANATFPPVGGRQRAAEGGGPYEGRRGKAGRTLCAPTHLGGDPKILNS